MTEYLSLCVRPLFGAAFAALAIITGVTGALAQDAPQPTDYAIEQFGAPPPTPTGPLTEPVRAALRHMIDKSFDQQRWHTVNPQALTTVIEAKDPRVAWLITDMMRFTWAREANEGMSNTALAILGIKPQTIRHRAEILDHLIAWDIPSYPGYLQDKRDIMTTYIPGWDRIFVEGDIDWTMVTWGGVNIDARPFGETAKPCNCIPAVDNPRVSSAAEATWLRDDAVVFGIVINGEARAYPRRIMEVREMVNDTLGGRDLGIPYCTLCGAAQAYFTDDVPEGVDRPVLRTSGLLIRSNKVMYDVNTYSVFDTFLGKAVTGPLAEKGVQLKQASVVTTDWGTWKAEHPDTTVLVEALALGRDMDLRNTRDANGPIFPVGDVDPRLPVQEDIIGVTTASGTPIAFHRTKAIAALKSGAEVGFENVRLALDGGGVKAVDADGGDLGSHQAFWFAWSQFHPGTELWPQ